MMTRSESIEDMLRRQTGPETGTWEYFTDRNAAGLMILVVWSEHFHPITVLAQTRIEAIELMELDLVKARKDAGR